ncbi:hypothetical protein M885DRAFT_613466 [Pelagophyceae sp. CCMP2097]|nr:hypothetical protein M885DRAFT_613466 [Pelagophyceae sp. CCMP2097]
MAQRYGAGALYAFTVNYILGVGCLSMPYIFVKAGWLLASILIVSVSLMSLATVVWVAEAAARADVLRGGLSIGDLPNRKSFQDLTIDYGAFTAQTPLKAASRTMSLDVRRPAGDARAFSAAAPNADLQSEAFDECADELLAYRTAYRQQRVGAVRFGVSPAGLVSPAEAGRPALYSKIPRAALQRAFGFAWRLPHSIVLDDVSSILEATLLCRAFLGPYGQWAYQLALMLLMSSGLVAYAQVHFQVVMALLRFASLGVMVAGAVLAPLKPKVARDGKKVRGVFTAALATTAFIYLGAAGSRAFGTDTQPAVNLNFSHLRWRGVPPRLAGALNVVALGFPAADTFSMFPLIAVTLGNSYHILLGPRARHRPWRVCCRIAAAMPPILVAATATDVALTLQLGGLCGVWVASERRVSRASATKPRTVQPPSPPL